jgi:hypothetical protein
MAFGVTNLFSLSAPSTGYVNRSRQSKSIEMAEPVRDQLGVTKCIMPKPLVTIEVTISGKGDAGIGSMAAAQETTAGDVTVYSRRRTETNSEFPDFEIQAIGFDDLGSPSDPTGPSAPSADTPASGCPVYGLTSVGYAGTQSFELEEVMEQADPVVDADGTFTQVDFYDPKYSWSVSGVGDFPAELVLGSDGGLPDTVSHFSAGITVVESIEQEQNAGQESTWSASGNHWPGAA